MYLCSTCRQYAQFEATYIQLHNCVLARLQRQVVHNYAGKSMMGKSSTANSLFNENVAQVTSFQQDTARPQAIRRSAHGFELTVIDTPGLLDSDCVNTAVSVWCPSVVV